MPPAAATEWDRSGLSFETIATSAPSRWAARAAWAPARPPPTTRTSCFCMDGHRGIARASLRLWYYRYDSAVRNGPRDYVSGLRPFHVRVAQVVHRASLAARAAGLADLAAELDEDEVATGASRRRDERFHFGGDRLVVPA